MRAEFVARVRPCPFARALLTLHPQGTENLTLDQAATIPLTLPTATVSMYDVYQAPFGGLGLTPPWAAGGRGAYAGEPIVITAGASGVGQHGAPSSVLV